VVVRQGAAQGRILRDEEIAMLGPDWLKIEQLAQMSAA